MCCVIILLVVLWFDGGGLLAAARKQAAAREILLLMTPSEAPKASQAAERSEPKHMKQRQQHAKVNLRRTWVCTTCHLEVHCLTSQDKDWQRCGQCSVESHMERPSS